MSDSYRRGMIDGQKLFIRFLEDEFNFNTPVYSGPYDSGSVRTYLIEELKKRIERITIEEADQRWRSKRVLNNGNHIERNAWESYLTLIMSP